MPKSFSSKKRRAKEPANHVDQKSPKQLRARGETKSPTKSGTARLPEQKPSRQENVDSSSSNLLNSTPQESSSENNLKEDEFDQQPPSMTIKRTTRNQATTTIKKEVPTSKESKKKQSANEKTNSAEAPNNSPTETTFSVSMRSSFGFCILFFVFIATAGKFSPLRRQHTNIQPHIPLIGVGMGNLEHDLIESQITYALTDEMEYRMIDTAHDSQNELLIRNSIRKAMLFFQKEGRDDAQIHVVTKVSYTHLGYERTKLSVMESLKYLAQPNIRVHVLLNWPRCRDNFASWMNCEQHELDLPDHVKEAGPSPLLNREHAFKESWRALEDVFLKEIDLGEKLPSIESIGVSNFELDDLHELEKNARIRPHLLQGNVWTFLFDTQLMDYCRQKNIQFQAYNVISGIFGRRDATPNALESLIWTANELSGNNQAKFSPAQVVLKWLMQNNVSVIPRTGQIGHLQENSPLAIESLPPLTPNQQDTVRVAVEALLQGNDLDKPQARFVNTNIKMKVHIFWRSDNGQEHPVRENLLPGERFDTMTFPGHVFVVYDDIKSQKKEYTIEAGFGERQHISVLEL